LPSSTAYLVATVTALLFIPINFIEDTVSSGKSFEQRQISTLIEQARKDDLTYEENINIIKHVFNFIKSSKRFLVV
jgi:hypothetical protein